MQITVKVEGLDKTLAHLSGMQKQVRYAAAVALTRTAQDVKEAMPALMERELDRPVAFTKRGLFVRMARPQTLEAIVGFMDAQAKYMALQIAGGTRKPGPHGIKLPGNITLDSFGNIPRGTIAKLKAMAQDGTLAKGIARRLGVSNRRKGAAPIQLFLGKPQGRGWEKAPMGIWRRVPGSPGKLIPVIVFDEKPVRYKPRFHFHDQASRIVTRRWPDNFDRAMADALRTAR